MGEGGSRSGSSVGKWGGAGGPNPKVRPGPSQMVPPSTGPKGNPGLKGERARSKDIRIQGETFRESLPFPSCPLWAAEHILHAGHRSLKLTPASSDPSFHLPLSHPSLPGSRLDAVIDTQSTEEETKDQRQQQLRAACPSSVSLLAL